MSLVVVFRYVRRVDHSNHAGIAVSDLAAVEPKGACIVHSEGKDGGLN